MPPMSLIWILAKDLSALTHNPPTPSKKVILIESPLLSAIQDRHWIWMTISGHQGIFKVPQQRSENSDFVSASSDNFDRYSIWYPGYHNCALVEELWTQYRCGDRPVGLVLRQTRGFSEAIFPSSSYWSGSLSSRNSVLKNATFWWEFRHQLFSFLVTRNSVSFFWLFWISCEVGSLQGCQAETAADWKDHIYVPVGIMQGIFSLSSTSERLCLYSKCLASVWHPATCWRKIYLWWKGDGRKNKLSNTILHII